MRRFLADFGSSYAASGLVGFIFAATGPVAIILAVGVKLACPALFSLLAMSALCCQSRERS